MATKQEIEKVTVKEAMRRLKLSKPGVFHLINSGYLTAKIENAPTPYYLITVEENFIAKEKARNQTSN